MPQADKNLDLYSIILVLTSPLSNLMENLMSVAFCCQDFTYHTQCTSMIQ